MKEIDDNLNTTKSEPMKKGDWFLLAILILLLLLSFPVLWRLYRFLIPLAAVGFIGYFAFKFMQLGQHTEGNDNGSQNFTKVWTGFVVFLRAYFRAIALTVISMIVVAVTVILVYGHYSKGNVTEKEMEQMTQSLAKYKSHSGQYPAGLTELIGNDPLKRDWFLDSWGNEMDYKVNTDGLGYTLSSSGADGKLGTADDIVIKKK
jgi:hypothetical protein